MKNFSRRVVVLFFLVFVLAGCSQEASLDTPLFAGGNIGWWEENGGDHLSIMFLKENMATYGKEGLGSLGYFTQVDKNTYDIIMPKKSVLVQSSVKLVDGPEPGVMKMEIEPLAVEFKSFAKFHRVANESKSSKFKYFDKKELDHPVTRTLKIISISKDEMKADFDGKIRKFFLVYLKDK